MRTENRQELVRFVRLRTQRQMAAYGASREDIESAKTIFDPNALTLGFARRFATYKRPNLLLHDPERLANILTNQKHPVQLVLAGKAHPADQAGKDMIREWIHFVRRHDIRQHAVFLVDYDMLLAERIVEGVDVWINTPRRPWEASGTSGMKVLANGGLNLSELDGWWAEAYTPEVGWALGDGREHGDDPGWDAAEALQMYDLLERDVIARFYDRDGEGLPRKWIATMRESMARLTPEFSANRTVREYTEKYYLPAAAMYRQREASRGALAQRILQWRQAVAEHWSKLKFGQVNCETAGDFHNFRVQVYLGRTGIRRGARRTVRASPQWRASRETADDPRRGAGRIGQRFHLYGAGAVEPAGRRLYAEDHASVSRRPRPARGETDPLAALNADAARNSDRRRGQCARLPSSPTALS